MIVLLAHKIIRRILSSLRVLSNNSKNQEISVLQSSSTKVKKQVLKTFSDNFSCL